MSRQVWNQHAYSLTNVEDDLSIPAVPELNWLEHNTYRSGDPQPMPSWYAPDAVPLAEVCYTDCPQGQLTLFVRLANEGGAAVRSNVPITVYTDSNDPTALETFWTSSIVDAGSVSRVFSMTLDSQSVIGEWLRVVVDDDAGIQYVSDECIEDNNTVEFWDVRCLE